jgi:hypothetical protein
MPAIINAVKVGNDSTENLSKCCFHLADFRSQVESVPIRTTHEVLDQATAVIDEDWEASDFSFQQGLAYCWYRVALKAAEEDDIDRLERILKDCLDYQVDVKQFLDLFPAPKSTVKVVKDCIAREMYENLPSNQIKVKQKRVIDRRYCGSPDRRTRSWSSDDMRDGDDDNDDEDPYGWW